MDVAPQQAVFTWDPEPGSDNLPGLVSQPVLPPNAPLLSLPLLISKVRQTPIATVTGTGCTSILKSSPASGCNVWEEEEEEEEGVVN